MEKTVAIYTLGCKTNQYESNAIIQEFINYGYKIVDFEESADVYIVNTCTVTNMSDRKSRQILRRAKKRNKNSILVATGCYVQVSKGLLDEIKEIDIILGNNEKKDVVKYVEEFKQKREEKVTDLMKEKEYLEFGNTTYTEKTRAVIKIQDGCDNFCTYCIIPFARGRVRSRNIENIKSEIERIAKLGIKEVVLTGIQIASYGKDLDEDVSLIDLLEEINKINRNRKNKTSVH
ncbi:MAG: radical SAM protein [Clostridia bacterium]|nr:radical SAM protein [Clostridia bacterium]